MGKGMGAVDKNMRKELSLEIDGHAFAAAHESNIAARRMAPTPARWHGRHATDATSARLIIRTQVPRPIRE